MPLSLDVVESRARKVQLVLLDVDGVLTDGSVIIGEDGREAKAFNIRDGAGLVWAQREGLQVGLLSARPSQATAHRAAELGIDLVLQTGPDKRSAYLALLRERALTDYQVAYMGDDLLDLPILGRVGLSAAPVDAAEEVLSRVHWVSRFGGGRGAVRELVELVLRARTRWDRFVNQHLR
jgi:3-deoxy-D-manno-octulosonate 8-phosphate phosphatase (KDO 8-P phosphatase)